MLFMPKKTSKEMIRNLHDKWLKEKRENDLKRREEYLKNKGIND